MRSLFFTLAILTLAACASTPSSTSASRSQNWWAYRNVVLHERDQGTITPVAAEEKIESKYREIYGPIDGPDPEMEGVFAYSRRLYVMAEAGQLSTSEADALTAARIRQIQARDAAQVQFHSWLESRFPPNGGD
jgi:hypothetical protein